MIREDYTTKESERSLPVASWAHDSAATGLTEERGLLPQSYFHQQDLIAEIQGIQ
jgi:hypothetical protein